MHRTFLAGLAICLLWTGCGRHDGVQQLGVAQQLVGASQQEAKGLPAPSTLNRAASVASTPVNPCERVRLGTDESLPVNARTEWASAWNLDKIQDYYRLRFTPYAGTFPGTKEQIAYHGYRLKPDVGSSQLDFHLDWYGDAPAAGNFYFALGDFSTDSWFWLEESDPHDFSLPVSSRFLNSNGEVFVVVVVLKQQAVLSWIRVGGDVPPFCGFILDYWEGPSGPVRFDCSLDSFDVDGELVEHDFDFDGDGVCELNNGANPMAVAELAEPPKAHQIGVKVTDNSGQSAYSSRYVFVNDWQAIDMGERELIGLVMDEEDRMHLCLRDGAGYQYLVGNQAGWQEEQLATTLTDGMECVALALDHQEQPAILCVGESFARVLRRRRMGWAVDSAPDLQLDAVPYPKYTLSLDAAGRPHVAVGSDTPRAVGPPGDSDYFYNPVRYWAWDGTDWNLLYTRDDCAHFYGFALDTAGIPYLAYSGSFGDEIVDAAVFAYADAGGRNWLGEQISEHPLGSSQMILGEAGAAHVWVRDFGNYYSRQAGSWTAGPNHYGDATESRGFLVDQQGLPHLVQSGQWGFAEHALLSGDAWEAEAIMWHGRCRIHAPCLGVTGNGQVHVITETSLNDPRYEQIGKEGKQYPRLMHYWK